jgi:hypothetical protein
VVLAVATVIACEEQTLSLQSVPSAHARLSAQAFPCPSQLVPPQSIAVSLPFFTPSMHEEVWQVQVLPDGQAMGAPVVLAVPLVMTPVKQTRLVQS